jgi:hypothetical protein
MILKEAFRMQNKLTSLIAEAQLLLVRGGITTKVTEKHLRKKANPNAEDETIEVKKDTDYEANRVIKMLMELMEEKNVLSQKISDAKRGSAKDIDMLVANNKAKQNVLRTLSDLADLKANERTLPGRGYLINGEGNQTAYSYEVQRVEEIDFDRKVVKGIVNRLRKEIDETSSAIDVANVTIEVDFTSKFDVNDTFEDAYEKVTA